MQLYDGVVGGGGWPTVVVYVAIGGRPKEEMALGLRLPRKRKRMRKEESSAGW